MDQRKFKRYEKYLNNNYFSKGENYFTSELVSNIYKVVDGDNETGIKQIKKEWELFLENRSKKRNLLSFYTHIPYCKNKCSYCNTGSEKLKSKQELQKYVKKIIEFYHYFENTFKNEVFNNLYIGGGTPNILSEKLLDKLLTELHSSFNIGQEGERTVENNPVNSSVEKLKILKKHNINRVSFGVQSFNQKVLELNNRGEQTEEMVRSSVADAKKVGFDCINIDLMIGLYGDNTDIVVNSFEKAMKLEPDSISIYATQPVESYLVHTYNNISKKDFFSRRRKIINDFFNKANILVRKYNYQIPGRGSIKQYKHLNNADSIVFKKKNSNYNPNTRYVPNPIDNSGSIFALGFDSSSVILDSMRYFMQDRLQGEIKNYKFKTITYSLRREMLQNIIINFSNIGYINFNKFKNRYGVEIKNEFKKVINELQDEGVLRIKRDGLYFKPDNPKERFIYLLYFFDEEVIEKYIEIKENKKKQKSSGDSENDLESLNVDSNVKNKIKKFNSQLNSKNSNRFEGDIRKIIGNKIEITTKNRKKKTISINDKTLIVEFILRLDDFKTIKIRKIDIKDLNKNDSVVVSFEKNGPYLFLKKITVKE